VPFGRREVFTDHYSDHRTEAIEIQQQLREIRKTVGRDGRIKGRDSVEIRGMNSMERFLVARLLCSPHLDAWMENSGALNAVLWGAT
jgi:hypothetical protein